MSVEGDSSLSAQTLASADARATLADGVATSSTIGRELVKGDLVGRYMITARLGHGGMGVVYAAYDPDLDRKLAIKVLHPEARGSLGSSSGQQRMVREARAMAKLMHPNVIAVHDVGTFEKSVFVAMEFIEGETAAQWLEAAPRPWREVLDVFRRAGDGLAAAHEAGLVHRDFKPDNVMIAKGGRVVVMDFGLARTATDEEERTTAAMPIASDERLTRTGALLGTPAYMAPEQHLGLPTTPQTDQFSYCVALHEALWGMRPFDGDTLAQLSLAVTEGRRVDPPHRLDVPPRIHRAIVRGLSIDPSQRWPSVAALVAELVRDPARRRKRALAIAAVPVLAVAGALGLQAVWGDTDAGVACSGGEERFASAWNDERRTAVRAAFAATGLPHQDEQLRRLETALDRTAVAWSAAHREACEATHVHGTQSADLLDRRMRCLDRRLGEIEAEVGELARADAKLVHRAVQVVSGLGDLRACADTDALMAQVPPPDDPERRAKVEALQAELGTVKAMKSASRLDEAVATAQRVVDEATALDWGPLRAEALYVLAQAQTAKGDPAAEKSYVDAFWTARKSGNDRVAAQVASELIVVVGESRPEEVATWEQHARVEVERLGDEGEIKARLLDDLGMAALQRRDLDAAEKFHREALALWETVDREGGLDVAVSAHDLGNVLFLRGDDEGARAHYERALAIWEAQLGPDHPQLANGYTMLGNMAHRAGDLEAADREFTRATEVVERAFGPTHIELAPSLNGLALVAEARGQLDRALAIHQRALDLSLPVHGELHFEIATIHQNMADVLLAMGRREDALAKHRFALQLRETTLGRDHPVASESLLSVGEDLVELGRPDEAIEPLERSLAIREQGGADARTLFPVRFALAKALWASKRDRAKAIAMARRARDAAAAMEDGEKKLAAVDAWLAEHARGR